MNGKKMDAKIINPFINATRNVLQTMAFMESKPGKPYLKNDPVAEGDVTGLIGITGEANGTISVTFETGSILKVVSNMFGEEITEVGDEVIDAVGEITNMISGQARRELEEQGQVFKAAIPSVLAGVNHRITHITKGPVLAIPFLSLGGRFVIEVCIDRPA
jgi:chemotaxis protein CheX